MRISVLVLLVVAIPALAEENLRQLFERARMLEEKNQSLAEAIQLYGQVVSRAKREPALAARAQYQQGLLYERLGRQPEAQRAYRAVVAEFAGQAEAVRLAKAKIDGAAPPAMVARQLWADPGVASSAVSPDGRFLSFSDRETGDLAVRDLTTGEKRRLTNKGTWAESSDYALSSVVSPDARQIAYNWYNSKGGFTDLRVVAVNDAAGPRVVFRNREAGYIVPAAWSLDGKQILAVLSLRDDTNQIAWISATDGSQQVLKSLPGWRYPGFPSLSPDGRFIAYGLQEREDAAESDIFLLAADGSREVPLIQHPAHDGSPVWTPDGKKVVFGSTRTGTRSLWAIAVADGKPLGAPTLVKPDAGNLNPMGFARDGSFYYSLSKNMEDVYVAELDPVTGKLGSPPAPVPQRFVGRNFDPAWSSDGQYLAYYSSRQGGRYGPATRTIVIRSMKTGEERDLPSRLDYGSPLRWFPDNNALLVPIWRSGWEFHRVDVQTGEARRLLTASSRFLPDPVLSPDGKTIYYLHKAQEEKTFSIRAHEIESRQEKEVFRAPKGQIRYPAVSSDGRQLVFLLSDPWIAGTQEIRVMPAEGGESRVLVKKGYTVLGSGYFCSNWSQDGRYVLFFHANLETRMAELWRVPAQGGEPEKLELAVRGDVGFPSLHPDGRRIAFSSREWDQVELWVIQNFLPELRAAR